MQVPEAAKWFHQLGVPVIPFRFVPESGKKANKKPLVKSWIKWQTEPQTEEEWEQLDWSHAEGWFVVCGVKASNGCYFAAFDRDSEDFDPSTLPVTVFEQTPNHGYHAYYWSKRTRRGRKFSECKWEFLGEGNLCGMYPSLTGRNDYEDITIVEDAWLIFEQLVERAGGSMRDAVEKPLVRDAQIIEGERNNTLFQSACVDRTQGLLVEVALERTLLLNRQSCNPPLSTDEVKSLVQSAYKKSYFEKSAGKLVDESDRIQLHVHEHITPGEIATQLKSMFMFATTDDTAEMFYYKTGVYLPNAEAVVKGLVQKAFEKIGLRDQPTSHFIVEVLGHLERGSFVNRREFDKDQHILNLKNGLFNMQTGELQPHDPTYLSRKQIPVAYNAEAKCPEIVKFLEQVQPDEEDRQAVVEHASIPLLKSNFLEKAFMYIGAGRNGKSIWFTVISTLYGLENLTELSLHDIQWDRFATATLDGKMLNVHDDISAQEIRVTGKAKQLISGNLPMSVQRKGKNRHSMLPPFPILYFSANQLPEVEDRSDAWMRRWECVQWNVEFNVGDETAKRLLIQKLTTQEELEGLLAWLLQTARTVWKNERLTRESPINQVREEWILRSDIVLAFLKETVEADVEGHIPKEQLYSTYKEWCKQNSYLPKAERAFVQKLREYYTVETYNPKIGIQQIRCWKGIKLADTTKSTQRIVSNND